MKYYAVYKGFNIGIFNSWKECKSSIDGYRGAVYKKFDTQKEAEYFLKNGKIKENTNTLQTFFNTNTTKTNTEKTTNTTIDDYYDKDIKTDKLLLDVYTDGSCITWNDNRFAGYGIYIREMNIEIKKRLDEEHKTNNRAELTAIIKAVKSCKKYMDDYHICIHTDSQYSMNALSVMNNKNIENNFMKNGEDIPNRDIIEPGLKIMQKYVKNISLLKIKAHTGLQDIHSKGNEMADKLANEGSLKDILHYCKINNMRLNEMPIPFGKYKEKSIKWIYTNDKKYMSWLLNNNEMMIKYSYFYECLNKCYNLKK